MPETIKQNHSNADPIHHYTVGRDWEASGNWGKALLCYQKSIACMPHILGAQPWFGTYLLDGRQPKAVGREQASDIYAALGRSYESVQSAVNALFAYRAAAFWHANHSVVNRIEDMEAVLKNDLRLKPLNDSGHRTGFNVRTEDMNELLTLIITTNFTNKLRKFSELSPPSSKLVSATYGSMLQIFGAPVTLCSKLLCYDYPAKRDGPSEAYEKALEIFSRRHDFEMYTYPGVGLHQILRQLIPTITTPYMALIEHDWFFQGPEISLPDLLSTFVEHPDIHHVRFNKRVNYIANWDYLLEGEKQKGAMPLIRTTAYSNNPCIIRTEKLRSDWLSICGSDPEFSSMDQSGSAMGIEEPLLKRFMQETRRYGFSSAHRHWGTYIYGDIGEPPRIIHLGE